MPLAHPSLLHISSTTALPTQGSLTIITRNIYLHIQTDAQGGDVEAGGMQAAAFYGINLPKLSQPDVCERSSRACLPVLLYLGKQFTIHPSAEQASYTWHCAELLLWEDQAAKSPQPAQSSFQWQQQGAEQIPFLQKQIGLSKSKDSSRAKAHMLLPSTSSTRLQQEAKTRFRKGPIQQLNSAMQWGQLLTFS